MLIWSALLLPALASAAFFEHVEMDHVPIVKELGGQDFNSLDQNTVLTNYMIKVFDNDYTGKQLATFQRKALALMDNELKLLYRFYGEKILDTIDLDRLKEEMDYITSLASPLIISSFKTIVYVDTDRFNEDVLTSGYNWLIIFVKNIVAEDVAVRHQQALSLVGDDLSLYSIKTGLVQCDNNPDFCERLRPGVTLRTFPGNVQYEGELEHNDIFSFVIKQTMQSEFYKIETEAELRELAAKRELALVRDSEKERIPEVFLMDAIAKMQTGFTFGYIDCTNGTAPLCKDKAMGISTVPRTGNGTAITEQFVENARSFADMGARNDIRQKLIEFMADQRKENLLDEKETEKLLTTPLAKATLLYFASQRFELPRIYIAAKGHANLDYKIHIRDTNTTNPEILKLGNETEMVILRPSSNSTLPPEITPMGAGVSSTNRAIVHFLDTLVQFPEHVTIVTEKTPPEEEAFVILNIDLCYLLEFHPDGLAELGNAIKGLHDGCNADSNNCDYSVNVRLGAHECRLEVAKSDDVVPIYFGYLVGDNIVQMMNRMQKTIFVEDEKECPRYHLAWVRGTDKPPSDVDILLLNQALVFDSSEKGGGPSLCWVESPFPSPDIDDDEEKKEKEKSLDEPDPHGIWRPENDGKFKPTKRSAYLFNPDYNITFTEEIPTKSAIKRWYYSASARKKKPIREIVPWDVVQLHFEEGKTLVLVYETEIPKDELALLEEGNQMILCRDMVKIDREKHPELNRRMKLPAKLPALILIQDNDEIHIPHTTKGELLTGLGRHLVVAGQKGSVEEGQKNLFVSSFDLPPPRGYDSGDRINWLAVSGNLNQPQSAHAEDYNSSGYYSSNDELEEEDYDSPEPVDLPGNSLFTAEKPEDQVGLSSEQMVASEGGMARDEL